MTLSVAQGGLNVKIGILPFRSQPSAVGRSWSYRLTTLPSRRQRGAATLQPLVKVGQAGLEVGSRAEIATNIYTKRLSTCQDSIFASKTSLSRIALGGRPRPPSRDFFHETACTQVVGVVARGWAMASPSLIARLTCAAHAVRLWTCPRWFKSGTFRTICIASSRRELRWPGSPCPITSCSKFAAWRNAPRSPS